MSRTHRVVVLGRGPGRAAAAAAFLDAPGVALINDTAAGDAAAWTGGWTAMMRELRRLDVDLTRFRPGNDPDEIPLSRYVSTPVVAGADVLLADLSLAPETVRAALYHARGKVILEPDSSLTWATTFAPSVHVLVPGPDVLQALHAASPDASATADRPDQARDLAQRLRVAVVVPLNPSTTLLARRDQPTQTIQAPTGPPGSSDRGADDCFRGVLAALIASRTPLPEAVRTATHASALWSGGKLAGWPAPGDLTITTAQP